jgi:hypothetical protein
MILVLFLAPLWATSSPTPQTPQPLPNEWQRQTERHWEGGVRRPGLGSSPELSGSGICAGHTRGQKGFFVRKVEVRWRKICRTVSRKCPLSQLGAEASAKESQHVRCTEPP